MNKDSRREIWAAARIAVATVLLSAPIPALAADLKPETLQQWDQYVSTVDARNQEHLGPGALFVMGNENREEVRKLRAGQILVWPANLQVPLHTHNTQL